MTFPHSRIRTPRVKKSLDEEYEISPSTCEIHYALYEPLLIDMCMCNQSKTATLVTNETNFMREKTWCTLSRWTSTFPSSYCLHFWELWANTTKQVKKHPLNYFLNRVRSSKPGQLFNCTTGNQHAGGLFWYYCGIYWGRLQMPGNYPPLTPPPKTPRPCTSVTTSVLWPSLTFLLHWPPYNETGHN